MVTRWNLLAGLLAAAVLGISGCAAPEGTQSPPAAQTPTVQTQPTTTPTGVGEKSLSPPVSRPLAVIGVSACDLVPTSQLAALGLDPSTVEDHSNADTADCRWFSNGRRFVAALGLSNVRGLESMYLFRDTFHYFEPTEIAGYPAVRTTSPDEWYTCYYMTGIGPNRSVSVSISNLRGEQGTDYSTLVRSFLATAIANLSAE